MPGLFGVPMPVVTTAVGFAMKAYTANADAKQQKDERMQRFQMEMMAATNENAVKWMKAQNQLVKSDKHFTWTRRTLALGIVFGSMIAMFLAPLLFPSVPFIYEVVSEPSWLAGFFASESVEFVAAHGIQMAVVYDFLSFLGVIVGMYFGDNRK